jgi:hypothetical protein
VRVGHDFIREVILGVVKESPEGNPWAICTASVGRQDEEKYEDCVKSVKKESDITEATPESRIRSNNVSQFQIPMTNDLRSNDGLKSIIFSVIDRLKKDYPTAMMNIDKQAEEAIIEDIIKALASDIIKKSQ